MIPEDSKENGSEEGEEEKEEDLEKPELHLHLDHSQSYNMEISQKGDEAGEDVEVERRGEGTGERVGSRGEDGSLGSEKSGPQGGLRDYLVEVEGVDEEE